MTYIYEPFGEFELPRTRSLSLIDDVALSEVFWPNLSREHQGLAEASGCYILGIRHSTGIKPWYVGKANGKDGFYQEVLNDRNTRKFNAQIDRQRSGTPVLFLLARMTPKGKFRNDRGERDLKWLEDELIRLALVANPELINSKSTDMPKRVVLPGVINSPKGRYSKTTKRLRRCLNLYSVERSATKDGEKAALQDVLAEIKEQIVELDAADQSFEMVSPSEASETTLTENANVERSTRRKWFNWRPD